MLLNSLPNEGRSAIWWACSASLDAQSEEKGSEQEMKICPMALKAGIVV